MQMLRANLDAFAFVAAFGHSCACCYQLKSSQPSDTEWSKLRSAFLVIKLRCGVISDYTMIISWACVLFIPDFRAPLQEWSSAPQAGLRICTAIH